MHRARHPDELRQLFRGAALSVLAGSAAGCGEPMGATPGGGAPQTPLSAGSPSASSPTCTPMWNALGAIAPAVVVDSVAWNPKAPFSEIIERGVRCETATQPNLCEAQFEEAAIEASIVSGAYIVTTAGDEVRVRRGTELLEYLGDIDTADEALIAATNAGFVVECHAGTDTTLPSSPHVTVDTVKGGFEVRLFPPPPLCESITHHRLWVSPTGVTTVLERRFAENYCPESSGLGRPPAGLVAPGRAHDPRGIGATLARAAHLEAASVDAFERFERELTVHGAPRHFRRAALDAADDEVRHARAMARLASRFGAEPPRVEIDATPHRSFEEVALNNALEGCIGETYAAMVATFQSLEAEDREVRIAMRQIAEDETLHAALSWQVHAWTLGKLTPRVRRDVRAAQRRRLAALRAEATASPAVEVRSTLGLPNAWQAQRLLDHLERALLSA